MLEDTGQLIRDLQQKNKEQVEINRDLNDKIDLILKYLNFNFDAWQIRTIMSDNVFKPETTLAELTEFILRKNVRTGE